MIALGVLSNEVYVSDGHAEYSGKDSYILKSDAAYPLLKVAEKSDAEKFKQYLKIHQQGQTDFMTFCRHSAGTGVEKWTIDLENMTCTYYDKAKNIMLVEIIPTL